MESLGSKVYEYRKLRGMSRRSLSEGICDESTLYRIEHGLHYPHIYTLKLLCQRLGIPIHQLLTAVDREEIQYIYQTKQRCRQLVYEKKFADLDHFIEVIEKDIKHRNIVDIDFMQFVEWHKVIVLHELKKEIHLAKNQLLQLCPESGVYVTETEIGIANSLGYVYLELNDLYSSLEIFRSIISSYDHFPFIEDKLLYVRVLYNFIYTHYQTNCFDEVIKYGLKLLDFLEANHIKIMSSEIHHMLGATYEKLNHLADAFYHMKKAVDLFYINDDIYFYLKSLGDLAELYLKSGNYEKGLNYLQIAKEQLKKLNDPKELLQMIEDTERKYLELVENV